MNFFNKKEPTLIENNLYKFANWIYPPVCGICGKLSSKSLCNKCEIALKKQAAFKIEDYSMISSFFDEHMYMFYYEGKIRDTILSYKFNEKSYIYETFVNFLKNNKKMIGQIKKYDIIIPVPISKKRIKNRGYNQSALLARKIASTFQIKYDENILKKIKDNSPQSELNKEDRFINVQNVYKLKRKDNIKNKKVLLVDDIFTTGNTVNECSKILLENSAKDIGIFTLAKD